MITDNKCKNNTMKGCKKQIRLENKQTGRRLCQRYKLIFKKYFGNDFINTIQISAQQLEAQMIKRSSILENKSLIIHE